MIKGTAGWWAGKWDLGWWNWEKTIAGIALWQRLLLLLCCPYQLSLRWSLKEEICLCSLPLFHCKLFLLGTFRKFGMQKTGLFYTVLCCRCFTSIFVIKQHKSQKCPYFWSSKHSVYVFIKSWVWLQSELTDITVTDLFLDQLSEKQMKSFDKKRDNLRIRKAFFCARAALTAPWCQFKIRQHLSWVIAAVMHHQLTKILMSPLFSKNRKIKNPFPENNNFKHWTITCSSWLVSRERMCSSLGFFLLKDIFHQYVCVVLGQWRNVWFPN